MTYPTQGPAQPDANDWLMSGGTKSASFNGQPPITWAGQVLTEPVLVQKRDFDSGEPLVWQDGRPRQMLQVNIQTNEQDPSDPEDDGSRALYLEFRKAQAVKDAVKRAGAKGIQPGGYLSLTYVSDDHAARKGKGNPPKNFTAEYRAPDPLAVAQQGGQQAPGADPWSVGPPGGGQWQTQGNPPVQPMAPPPAAQPAAPVAAPAPAPATAASAVDPQLKAFLESKGVTVGPDMTPATAQMIAKSLS